MKMYKKSNTKQNEAYALPHILHNHIYCHYYMWVGCAGGVDILKIDGRYRYFDIKTHEEIKEPWHQEK